MSNAATVSPDAATAAKSTLAHEVECLIRQFPAKQLLRLLHGEQGVEVARAVLGVLTDGWERQQWKLGSQHTLTHVDSVAHVAVKSGRADMLFDLVRAGPPQVLAEHLTPAECSPDPKVAQAAWLRRLCRARTPVNENELVGDEFEETSLYLLGTRDSVDRGMDLLLLALELEDTHEDVECVQKTGTPEAKARLKQAMLAHQIRLATQSAAATPPAVAPTVRPARRARVV